MNHKKSVQKYYNNPAKVLHTELFVESVNLNG